MLGARRDLRITIWFGIIYLLSFFWRSNIGNGNLETITPTITVSVPDYDKAFACGCFRSSEGCFHRLTYIASPPRL